MTKSTPRRLKVRTPKATPDATPKEPQENPTGNPSGPTGSPKEILMQLPQDNLDLMLTAFVNDHLISGTMLCRVSQVVLELPAYVATPAERSAIRSLEDNES